ncbi:hypothetical protein PFISCL1PPCAC_7936, partial [Pristionchus fissidentatus]
HLHLDECFLLRAPILGSDIPQWRRLRRPSDSTRLRMSRSPRLFRLSLLGLSLHRRAVPLQNRGRSGQEILPVPPGLRGRCRQAEQGRRLHSRQRGEETFSMLPQVVQTVGRLRFYRIRRCHRRVRQEEAAQVSGEPRGSQRAQFRGVKIQHQKRQLQLRADVWFLSFDGPFPHEEVSVDAETSEL